MPLTLSIVEDVQGTREGLLELFHRTPDIVCLGAYASTEEAVVGIPRERPEVALVDINLPGRSGIACVAELKQLQPTLLVLMLTTYEESDLIFAALRAGANGYLLKNRPAEELLEAIREVRGGGAPMSMQIARKVVAHFHYNKKEADGSFKDLTKREHEILRLLGRGLLYKEIGAQLDISLSTVRTHVHAVYEKLHVQTRTEAVLKLLEPR